MPGAEGDGSCTAGEPGQRRSPQPGGALNLPGPAGGRGDRLVRPVPGQDGVTAGHLSPGSAAARAVGEGPWGAPGGEGLPRGPGNPGGDRPRPRAPGVLAEVVVSLQPAPPRRDSAGPVGWRPVRKGGASAGSRWPPGRSWRPPRGWAGSRGARWSLPRSARVARTGGPWAWRRPAPPSCSAGNSRPPPCSFAQALPGGVEPGPECQLGTRDITSTREVAAGRCCQGRRSNDGQTIITVIIVASDHDSDLRFWVRSSRLALSCGIHELLIAGPPTG